MTISTEKLSGTYQWVSFIPRQQVIKDHAYLIDDIFFRCGGVEFYFDITDYGRERGRERERERDRERKRERDKVC